MNRRAGTRREARGSALPAGAAAPPFSPLTGFSGLTVWIAGDDPSFSPAGFTWPNPGSASDFTQATASLKGTAGVISGRTACDFDGTDDRALSGALSTIIGTAWWASGVIEIDAASVGPASAAYLGHTIVGDNGAYWGVFAFTTGLQAFHAVGGLERRTPIDADTAYTIGAPTYFEAWWDGSTLHCRTNGAAASNSVSAGTPDSVAGIVSIGKSTFGAALNGRMGELAITTSVPTAGVIADWRDYCASRWGVSTP